VASLVLFLTRDAASGIAAKMTAKDQGIPMLRQLKPSFVRAFAALAFLMVAPVTAYAVPGNDLVMLAESSWGISIDKFAAIAGLKPGEYYQGNQPQPLPQDVQVISPYRNLTEGRWEPIELFPLSFEFTAASGLKEISGFLPSGSSQASVVAVATKLYGPPARSAQALNMITYVWIFKRTALEISPITFRLYPKQPGQ
jgi:hypothetical protein